MSNLVKYQPLFMFGFERSGTTLLSMIMGAHPDLAVPLSVTGLWYRYHKNLDRYHNLRLPQNLEALVDDLLQDERIRLWDETLHKADLLERIDGHGYAAVVDAFNQAYADKKNKRYWANLDIATLDDMDIAHQWFPNARFLHIVRDGRDVALSHETMPYGAANTLDCVQSWERRLTINQKMGEILGSDQYKLIRYEDLVLNTQRTLQEICEFASIEYSEQMLNYTEMVADKIPEDKRWLWPELDRKPQADKCYGWKRKMDLKRRIVFENEAAELLKRLGYEVYDRVPKKPIGYLYELWCFIGRGGRLKRLRMKLGVRRKSKLERAWRTRQS